MNLKRLAEISPIIGAFLIFLGFFRMHTYYNHWGIQISGYLDFSEILLSFLNDSYIIFLFIGIFAIQMTGVVYLLIRRPTLEPNPELKPEISVSTEVNEFSPNHKEQEKKNSNVFTIAFDKAQKLNPKILFLISAVVTILLLCVFLFFYCSLWVLYPSMYFLFQSMAFFFDDVLKIKNQRDSIQITLVSLLTSFCFLLAQRDIIIAESYSQQIELQISSGEHIHTDQNRIFIGKTNNYYFFFDKKEKDATVIPVETVLKTKILNAE